VGRNNTFDAIFAMHLGGEYPGKRERFPVLLLHTNVLSLTLMFRCVTILAHGVMIVYIECAGRDLGVFLENLVMGILADTLKRTLADIQTVENSLQQSTESILAEIDQLITEYDQMIEDHDRANIEFWEIAESLE
jgi:hypothetical protein